MSVHEDKARGNEGGVLPYMGYTGMWGAKGIFFSRFGLK